VLSTQQEQQQRNTNRQRQQQWTPTAAKWRIFGKQNGIDAFPYRSTINRVFLPNKLN
jgi:hypothetical protein